MKLFIDIAMERIYLCNIVAWNYKKKIGFPVCKKENVAGLQAHRKRGKSARASPTPHHSLKLMKSAALVSPPNIYPPGLKLTTKPFTGRTLRSLLIQMQNIGLQRSGCAESKETRQSWLLLLAFSPPLVFRFSCLFFFFRWRFSRLHFAGKRFWESF